METTIAIYGRRYDKESAPLYAAILQHLLLRGCNAVVVDRIYGQLPHNLQEHSTIRPFSQTALPSDALAVLSIGGDGTFLEAAKMAMATNIPILGINKGRLGFLSEVSPDRVAAAIDNLLAGSYRLVGLDILSLYADGSRQAVDYAVNEFAVSKCDNSSMLTIHAYVDGDYLTTYWADGLIVATATGSTAYSLSVGGPIVYPSTPNFVITPIAPHNLSLRPLIVPNSVAIQLHIEGRGPNILTSLDGRTHVMENDCRLRIAKTPFDVKMVQLDGHSFFAALRDKLMWGADMRNN